LEERASIALIAEAEEGFLPEEDRIAPSILEHFRNTGRLLQCIERWLFLEEKAT
jgi:hypothetical protein